MSSLSGDEKFAIGAILFWIVLWLAMIVGWVENIVKLVGSVHDPITLLTVLRIIGIFAAPFGSILGLFF